MQGVGETGEACCSAIGTISAGASPTPSTEVNMSNLEKKYQVK